MIVLCYGVTKSGSTLAFELCKSALQQKGYEQRRLSDDAVAAGHHVNFINDATIQVFERVRAEVAPQEIIALKMHASLGSEEASYIENAVEKDEMKVHVNLRDPREICLSLVDAGRKARENNRMAFAEIKDLNDASKIVSRQLNICRRWGAIKGALHLFYNDVAFETPTAVQQICDDFGFGSLTEAETQSVIDRVFKEAFTQRNKAVKDRYKDDLTLRQNDFLMEQVKGARGFIRRVCEQKDFSWFSDQSKMTKEGRPIAVEHM